MNRRTMFALSTFAAGVLLIVAVLELSLLAGPCAVTFVVAAFLWALERPTHAISGAPGWCRGCATGCVECRERIDVAR
ncbi:hypothetical protein ACVGOW_14080 [Pseudonocardia saturnea]